jgi:hypothetical protein
VIPSKPKHIQHRTSNRRIRAVAPVPDNPAARTVLSYEGAPERFSRCIKANACIAVANSGKKIVAAHRCLEAAFRFLLDREPKESILGRFEVTVISRYFPEFERELPRYLSAS